MPLQSVFTLFIVAGAFTTTGALIGSLNWLYKGKRKRAIANDHFAHHLQQRDWAIQSIYKDAK
jgi:hypothetical protein